MGFQRLYQSPSVGVSSILGLDLVLPVYGNYCLPFSEGRLRGMFLNFVVLGDGRGIIVGSRGKEGFRNCHMLDLTLPETNMETQKGAYKERAIWVSMLVWGSVITLTLDPKL